MEKTKQKNILETDLQLSTAYTIAFGKPTSKYEIQKYLTKSHRHTTIVDQYKEYFAFSERTDNRRGELIQSKPDLLLELLYTKIELDPKSKINIKKLLTNKLIEKTINKAVYYSINSGFRPINHNLLLKDIAILFLGKYIITEYRNFFKPNKPQEEYLQKSNDLNKHFLPDLYDKQRQAKHDKHSLEMKKILEEFNLETMKKIIYLYPDHKLFLQLPKAGIIIAESSK